MGTRLPLYPYIALDVERTGGKPRRVRDTLLQEFIAYISRRDVQELQYNLICNDFNPENDNWVNPTFDERDCHRRPRLEALVNMIGERGSIVLPTIGDLTGYQSKRTFSLIKKIIDQLIPVLTVDHDDFPLSTFIGDRADGEIFDAMVRNSMRNEILLRKIMQNEVVMEKNL